MGFVLFLLGTLMVSVACSAGAEKDESTGATALQSGVSRQIFSELDGHSARNYGQRHWTSLAGNLGASANYVDRGYHSSSSGLYEPGSRYRISNDIFWPYFRYYYGGPHSEPTAGFGVSQQETLPSADSRFVATSGSSGSSNLDRFGYSSSSALPILDRPPHSSFSLATTSTNPKFPASTLSQGLRQKHTSRPQYSLFSLTTTSSRPIISASRPSLTSSLNPTSFSQTTSSTRPKIPASRPSYASRPSHVSSPTHFSWPPHTSFPLSTTSARPKVPSSSSVASSFPGTLPHKLSGPKLDNRRRNGTGGSLVGTTSGRPISSGSPQRHILNRTPSAGFSNAGIRGSTGSDYSNALISGGRYTPAVSGPSHALEAYRRYLIYGTGSPNNLSNNDRYSTFNQENLEDPNTPYKQTPVQSSHYSFNIPDWYLSTSQGTVHSPHTTNRQRNFGQSANFNLNAPGAQDSLTSTFKGYPTREKYSSSQQGSLPGFITTESDLPSFQGSPHVLNTARPSSLGSLDAVGRHNPGTHYSTIVPERHGGTVREFPQDSRPSTLQDFGISASRDGLATSSLHVEGVARTPATWNSPHCSHYCINANNEFECCNAGSSAKRLTETLTDDEFACPAEQSSCPSNRFVTNVQYCSYDRTCSWGQKCCFDSCFQSRVCKTIQKLQ